MFTKPLRTLCHCIAFCLVCPTATFALDNPVIFVHGIFSGAETWSDMVSQLRTQLGVTSGGRLLASSPVTGPESCGHSDSLVSAREDVSYTQVLQLQPATRSRLHDARLFAIDFSSNDTLTFAQQAGELKTIVNCVKSLTGRASVTLVGHSMGGIASRHYLQNLGLRPYENDVERLITIGTPHKGARDLIRLAYSLPEWSFNISGAQLAPGSCAIRIMNESLSSNNGALAQDCGFGNATALPAILYRSVIGYDYDTLLPDALGVIPADTDDGIVSIDSQDMALAVRPYTALPASAFKASRVAVDECGAPWTTVGGGLVHVCETSNSDIIGVVARELEISPITAATVTGAASNISPSSATVFLTYSLLGAPSAIVGIEWGTDGTFPFRTVSQATTTARSTTIARQLSGLAAGQTINYRAVLQVGSTTWAGNTRYLMVPSSIPTFLPAPTIVYPTNGAVGQPDSFSLKWTAVSNASSYRLFVARNASDLPNDPTVGTCARCLVNGVSASTSYRMPATALLAGNTYFWVVHARSPDRYGTWSGPTAFTMAPSAPSMAAPTLLQPGTGAVSTGVTPTIQWGDVPGATSFRLRLAQSEQDLETNVEGLCRNCILNAPLIGTSFRVPTQTLQSPGTYYLAVRAVNGSQVSAWSSARAFLTHNPAAQNAPVTFALIAYSDDGGQGTVQGGGTFLPGTLATVTAYPLAAYRFDGWYENTVRISTDVTLQVEVRAPRTLVAKFRNFFDDTLVAGVASPASGGWVDGSGYFPFNAQQDANGVYTTARLTARPKPGYTFLGWFLGGTLAELGTTLEVRTVSYPRTYTAAFAPALALPIPPQTRIAFGYYGAVAVDSSNRVWGWGPNTSGLLDSGLPTPIAYPSLLPHTRGLSGVLGVAAGPNSFAISTLGFVSTWGSSGQSTGTCSGGAPTAPTMVALQNIVRVHPTEWETVFGLKSNGELWVWGNDFWYSGATYPNGGSCLPPTKIQGLTDVVAVSANGPCHAALKSDGTVWTWGAANAGSNGCLGDGSTDIRRYPNGAYDLTPHQIPFLSQIVGVSCGPDHCLAVRQDGAVFAWGTNTYGQLGDGTRTIRYTPVQVPGLTNIASVSVFGWDNSIAVSADGRVFTWGRWENGRLGTGATADALLPVAVSGISTAIEAIGLGSRTAALLRDGAVMAWGYNSDGGLAVGDSVDHPTPVPVRCSAIGEALFNLYNDGCPTSWTLSVTADHGHFVVDPSLPTYADLQSVRIWVSPDEGYQFDRFSGDATGAGIPAEVSMTSNRDVAANFVSCPSPTLAIQGAALVDGGQVGLNIQTLAGCLWRARTTAAWIHVTGADSTVGNDTVQFFLQPNPTAQPRRADVRVGASTVSIEQPARLAGCSLDIDGNGRIDGLTDGLLVTRYLLGFPISALMAGVTGSTSPFGPGPRTTPAAVISYLENLRTSGVLDVDGNGVVETADGLILLRLMLGHTGDQVVTTAGASGVQSRSTLSAVRAFVNTSCGEPFPL